MLDVGCLPRRSLTLTGNLMSGSMPSVWSLGNLTYVRRTHTRTTDAAGWADVGWCVSVGNEEAAGCVCEVCGMCVCVSAVRCRSLSLSNNLLSSSFPSVFTGLGFLQYVCWGCCGQVHKGRGLGRARGSKEGVCACAGIGAERCGSVDCPGCVRVGLCLCCLSCRTLSVSGNMLNDSLPESFSGLSSLRTLTASSNLLSGTLPPMIGCVGGLGVGDVCCVDGAGS